jgi:hypothetical protein
MLEGFYFFTVGEIVRLVFGLQWNRMPYFYSLFFIFSIGMMTHLGAEITGIHRFECKHLCRKRNNSNSIQYNGGYYDDYWK